MRITYEQRKAAAKFQLRDHTEFPYERVRWACGCTAKQFDKMLAEGFIVPTGIHCVISGGVSSELMFYKFAD